LGDGSEAGPPSTHAPGEARVATGDRPSGDAPTPPVGGAEARWRGVPQWSGGARARRPRSDGYNLVTIHGMRDL